MLAYYLKLALRSLRRTPMTTALMVLAIGLGIGASMTMLTVLHVMSRDPLPGKSDMLFYPHLDPLPKDYQVGEWGNPSDNFTWPDAMALLHAKRATHQAAMTGSALLIWPQREGELPLQLSGHYATSEFFAMFGVPLQRGHGWSDADDAAHARVVVLSDELAKKLFGNADPLGQTVQFGEKRIGFRVVGVTGDWNPQPLFYADKSEKGGFGAHDAYFLPLQTAVELRFENQGNMSCFGSEKTGSDSHTDPSCTWLQFWVQLDTPQQAADYQRFLYDYAAQQHASGRFQRTPETVKLYPLMAWLQHLKLVPNDVRLQTLLAIGFLIVCLVNIIALLLAKFLRRGGEVGVRRALGAQRWHIFVQFGIEALLIGTMGGVLGIAIAEFGLWSVRQRPDNYAKVAQMDMPMLLATVALAIVAAVLAGLLPAWRASRISPAIQIKAL